MMGYGWHFAGSGVWWILGLLCFIVLVGGIVWLVATVSRRDQHHPGQPWQPPYQAPGMPPPQPGVPPVPPRPSPHDILRERLARGEVTVEEYERVRAALGPDPYGPPPAK